MKKILFIDDERDLHPIMQSYFPKEDFRLIVAHDGSEGMQKCRNEDFDLLIVDYSMPKMDGAKFYIQFQDLMEAKKMIPPPIIFVSGKVEELKSRNLKWVRTEFLEKPFTKEMLLQKYSKLLLAEKKRQLKIENKVLLNPGDVLFHEGDDPGSLYYVVSGLLESRKVVGDGTVQSLGKISAGELVGEMAVLQSECHLTSVVALEATELLPIPSNKVMEIVSTQPRWIKLMLQTMGRRLREALKQIA